MTFEEAIKRLRQETVPATYCPDFDKEECLKVIVKEHKAFEIIKEKLDLSIKEYWYGKALNYLVEDECCYCNAEITEEENSVLKEILNDYSKRNEEEKERS